MDIKKYKMPLLAGGTILVVIILLLLSSSLKKTKSIKQEAPARQELTAPEKEPKSSGLAFADFDDVHDPLSTSRDDEGPQLTDGAFGDYPSPSFVSSSGDTLIYQGGIYARVGFVEVRNEPDTIIFQGRKYIELR